MDPKSVKLGKQPARLDSRTFKLARYLATDAPPAPHICDWTKGVVDWSMFGNDTLGDCTIASKGHGLQIVSLNTTGIITLPDQEIINYYSWWDGYVAGDPNTDQGGIILDVLNKWRKTNFAGHKLLAYVAPDLNNPEHIKQGLALFGVLDIGIQLPITAQDQVGKVWDVVGNPNDPNGPAYPGSWGGHDVNIVGYGHDHAGKPVFDLITWGGLQKMTWHFWQTYVDEAYILLLGYWLENGPAPSGFKMTLLEQDLVQLGTVPESPTPKS